MNRCCENCEHLVKDYCNRTKLRIPYPQWCCPQFQINKQLELALRRRVGKSDAVAYALINLKFKNGSNITIRKEEQNEIPNTDSTM